jgi:tetratricopeptide (TPR) repeat protein
VRRRRSGARWWLDQELVRLVEIESQLVRLVRKELIHPATPTLTGDQAFRFRHLLIRDAGYDALPKETRAELHERFADWLETRRQGLIELDEVLGYHFEQAARYCRELGRPEVKLERRAGIRLATAGSKAALRSDAHGAANLLRRALALLPRGDPSRPAAIIDQLAILEDLGETEERLTLIEELEEATDPAVRMQGRVARLALRIMTEPAEAVEEAETVAQKALALFTETGDDLGAAHAYSLSFWTSWVRSQAVPTMASLEQLLEHARRAGARVLADRAMMGLIGPLIYGPFEPHEIQARLGQLPTAESQLATVNVLFVEAELARREKRFDDALDLLRQLSSIERELGLDVGRAINMQRRAEVLRDAGRLDEATVTYRQALARLEELGQTSFRSTTLINLAQTLYRRGETDEAAHLAVEGEQLGAAEDVVNFAYGRALRARIAADRGAQDTAESLGRDALAYAYKTDFPSVHATAHEALAHVLAAAGRPDDARAELQRAHQRWQRYGFIAEAEKTGDLLAGSARPPQRQK